MGKRNHVQSNISAPKTALLGIEELLVLGNEGDDTNFYAVHRRYFTDEKPVCPACGSARTRRSKVVERTFKDILGDVPNFKIIDLHFRQSYLRCVSCGASVFPEPIGFGEKSVRYETVTKGLNHNAEMMDTNIFWIGAIPKHWKLEKLKRYTSMLTPMRDKPEHLDGDIPWIRIEDYEGKYISSSKEGLGVSQETVTAMNLKVYPVGTILCTSSCDLGKCAIVARELVSNQRFIGIIPNDNIYPDYLYYLMLSNAKRLNYLSTGSIQANLSRVAFEQLLVQVPPFDEQVEIATFLDEKISLVDALINEKANLISDLESYKKSLIYEVVTGKRKVV